MIEEEKKAQDANPPADRFITTYAYSPKQFKLSFISGQVS